MVFDARVIGLPDYVTFVRGVHGREGVSSLSRKTSAAEAEMARQLDGTTQRAAIETLRRRGELAAHICLERYGFLAPLQDWAKARCGPGNDFEDVFPQLAGLGTNDALILPVDFEYPLSVDVPGRVYAYPVASASHLFVELEACNRVLNVEKAFICPKVPLFLKASKLQLAKMEQREGLDDSFWAKFGLVVLRQLIQCSIQTKLPLIMAERMVVPV